MSTRKLKLNPDKTEFIIFGSKIQRDNLKACLSIDILGSRLCPVNSVRKLGVWFDSDCFRHVRQFPTHNVSVLVANAFVNSRLDYCNSLSGASPSSI